MQGKHWYCSKVEGNCMKLGRCKKRKINLHEVSFAKATQEICPRWGAASLCTHEIVPRKLPLWKLMVQISAWKASTPSNDLCFKDHPWVRWSLPAFYSCIPRPRVPGSNQYSSVSKSSKEYKQKVWSNQIKEQISCNGSKSHLQNHCWGYQYREKPPSWTWSITAW